jgi:hypothetical protein
MAPKATDPKKSRDARAKKLLLVMVPVLIALVAWQGPKVLNQVRGEAPAEAAPAAPANEASSGTEVPGTDPAATPSEAAPAAEESADGAALPVANQQALPDTDEPPSPDEGQLIYFSRFDARDPFVQLVDPEDAGPTEEPSVSTPTTGSSTPPPSTPPSSDTTGGTGGDTGTVDDGGDDTAATEVKISVNGKVNTLVVGDTFPDNDAAFSVVSISGDSVDIGLASGSFATGQQTITLKVGEPVTLISQPDGARFTLKLISTK